MHSWTSAQLRHEHISLHTRRSKTCVFRCSFSSIDTMLTTLQCGRTRHVHTRAIVYNVLLACVCAPCSLPSLLSCSRGGLMRLHAMSQEDGSSQCSFREELSWQSTAGVECMVSLMWVAAENAGMLCPCMCNNRLCVTVTQAVHTLSVAGSLHFKRDRAASLRLVIVAQNLEAGFGL